MEVAGSRKRVAAEWQAVLESPEYMLHSIDLQAGTFEFLKTSKSILCAASFLDGRSGLLAENQESLTLPIEQSLQWSSGRVYPGEPNRYIFHMSFCGSTLLARTLTVNNKVFCYKEPQIVLQLAEIKASKIACYQNSQAWKSLMSFVLGQFGLPWYEAERTIVKPSNWLNSMLPELLLDAGASKAVLLSISREAFLQAVFRGGQERVKFVHSLVGHLRTVFPEFAEVISAVEIQSQDTVSLFARLSLIAHAMQMKAFARVRRLLPADDLCDCNYDDLLRQPHATIHEASRVLELELTRDDIKNSVNSNFINHSKITSRAFSNAAMDAVNAQVFMTYHQQFSAALDWAGTELTPDRFE